MKYIVILLSMIVPIKLFSKDNDKFIAIKTSINQSISDEGRLGCGKYGGISSTITINYTIKNTQKTPVILNRYCTIKLTAISRNHVYEFNSNGGDAFTKIKSSDLIILKNGEETTLVVCMAVLDYHGYFKLISSDQSGNYWITDPIINTSEVEIKSQYINTLDEFTIQQLKKEDQETKYEILRYFTMKPVSFKIQ
jgi:hypothetical protein